MAERIATIPILPVEILLDIIKSVRNSSLDIHLVKCFSLVEISSRYYLPTRTPFIFCLWSPNSLDNSLSRYFSRIYLFAPSLGM